MAIRGLGGGSGGGGGGKFRKFRTWSSFVLAGLGSAILALTTVGNWFSQTVGRVPVLPAILLVLAIWAMICDIGSDREPNWLAVWSMLFAPLLARSVQGQLAQVVSDLAGQARAQTGAVMGGWLGLAGAALGITFVAMAFISGQGTLKRGR